MVEARALSNNQIHFELLAYFCLAVLLVATMVVGFSPIILIVLIFLVGLFLFKEPKLGLGLVLILTMVFERFFTLTPLVLDYNLVYKIYPLDIVLVLAVIAWLIDLKFNRPKTKWLFGWPEKILLLFVAAMAVNFIRSLFDLNADLSVAFGTFKNYAFYPLFYFWIIYSVQKPGDLIKLIQRLLWAGVALIAFIALGLILGQGLWTEYTPLSTAGTRLLAGTHAFYLTLVMIITLTLLAFKKFKNANLVILLLWLWFFGVLSSLMRHLWLALVFGALCLLWLIPKENKKSLGRFILKNGLAVIALIAVLALLVSLFSLTEGNLAQQIYANFQNLIARIISIIANTADTSVNWRLSLWQSAINSWSNNPLFGLGLGRKIPLEMTSFRTFEEVRNIHNSPLAITVQTGLVGLGLFVALVMTILIAGWLKIKKMKAALKPYYLGIMAAVLVTVFCSFFQPYLETNLFAIFFWFFLALLRTSAVVSPDKSR